MSGRRRTAHPRPALLLASASQAVVTLTNGQSLNLGALMAGNDRRVRIEVAKALEGAVPAGAVERHGRVRLGRPCRRVSYGPA